VTFFGCATRFYSHLAIDTIVCGVIFAFGLFSGAGFRFIEANGFISGPFYTLQAQVLAICAPVKMRIHAFYNMAIAHPILMALLPSIAPVDTFKGLRLVGDALLFVLWILLVSFVAMTLAIVQMAMSATLCSKGAVYSEQQHKEAKNS
jgi:hypothetical protein